MRKLTYILLLLAFTVLCSCGVKEEDKQIQKSQTIDMAEPATTAIFKNSETTEKTNYLENDYIRVWQDGDNYTWMQENLDGTERKSIENAGLTLEDAYSFNVEWLTNDWVYLIVWEDLPKPDEDSQLIFCRIPVRGKERTVYDTANKENLFQLDERNGGDWNDVQAFMVTDSYILYSYRAYSGDPHRKEYYCYDFRTKKTSLAFSMDDDIALIAWENGLPITINNCFFLQDGSSIYSVSFDTFEKTKIEPNPEDVAKDREFLDNLKNQKKLKNLEEVEDLDYYGDFCMTVHDGSLYFNWGFSQIFQYDGNSVNCVIDENTLTDNLDALKIADTGYISDIYIWDNKLYIYIRGFNYSGKRRTIDMLVSANFKNLKQWALDEEFMEYAMKTNYDGVHDFEQGKLFFSMVVNDEEEDLAYDLETRNINETTS